MAATAAHLALLRLLLTLQLRYRVLFRLHLHRLHVRNLLRMVFPQTLELPVQLCSAVVQLNALHLQSQRVHQLLLLDPFKLRHACVHICETGFGSKRFLMRVVSHPLTLLHFAVGLERGAAHR